VIPSPTAKKQTDAHVAKAVAYAQSVVKGLIPACKYVRQAAQRQLDDLMKYADHPIYYFDQDVAGRVCRFIERLPHVKGPKAKQGDGLIQLEPWQCFALTTPFGWMRKDTGGRRFRRVYIEVPRGNAKSTLSSGVGLYCLTSDGEQGAEVYSAATKRDQAKIVQGDAAAMMRKRAGFAQKLGVVVHHASLLHTPTNSKFEPLSRDYGSMDGLNVHLGLIDELHAHKDRGIYDVIETGAGKRPSSMIWAITTAGTDTFGICYEQRTYVSKILSGALEDDSYFGLIYTIDEEDDWTQPDSWRKANPNWGVSVMPEVIGQLAAKAMQLPAAQANFKTKHLDVWCQANNPWMDVKMWDACANDQLREEDFSDATCYFGLDLATKTDIASLVRLYKRYVENPRTGELEAHYYAFYTNWLPEAAVADGRNNNYAGWALEGHLTETPGEVIDFAVVKGEIINYATSAQLRECCYDPWQATQLAQELQDQEGLPMVEVRATVMNFSAPMKELEALVKAKRFHHIGSPALRWMVSNVVCHTDAKDNVYPRKERPENKIDAVVATIMALNRAMLDDDPYAGSSGFKTL
jgi:phage terminase large subunit-like protein